MEKGGEKEGVRGIGEEEDEEEEEEDGKNLKKGRMSENTWHR